MCRENFERGGNRSLFARERRAHRRGDRFVLRKCVRPCHFPPWNILRVRRTFTRTALRFRDGHFFLLDNFFHFFEGLARRSPPVAGGGGLLFRGHRKRGEWNRSSGETPEKLHS